MWTSASNLKALADVAAGVDPMPIGAAAPDAPTAPIEPAGLAVVRSADAGFECGVHLAQSPNY